MATTQHDLTTSWIELSSGDVAMALSVETDDCIRVATDNSEPSVSGHILYDGGSFSYSGPKKVWARLNSGEGEATVHVDQVSGGGVGSLFDITANVLIVTR